MNVWRGATPLVLASQSATRRNLLESAGIVAEVHAADIDERTLEQKSGLSDPQSIAALLAREKAISVARDHGGRYVLGADQTLSLSGELFNKPPNREAAHKQISALAGKTHELHSAIAVAHDDAIVFETVEIARLTMRPLNSGSIAAYLDAAGDRVLSSVGGYQLEGLGIHLFEKVEGDHATILGLPLLPLLAFFRAKGLLTI